MAIRILRNQPIDFNIESDSPDCGCTGRSFCQLIDPTDATQFQLGSSDLVINGVFDLDGEGWNDSTPILISVIDFSNETSEGACDGYITVGATHGSAPYRFSFNGGDFGSPAYNSGESSLCAGCYYVTVEDSLGQQASFEYCIDTNLVCGDYSLTTDFEDVNTIQLQNCYTTDFV